MCFGCLNTLISRAYTESTSVVKQTFLKKEKSEQEKMMHSEMCILVDEKDSILGQSSKLNCHKLSTNSMLHRAFSVFLFNEKTGKMLVSQRASSKITFPLVWTNAVCSHPLFVDEERNGIDGVMNAAYRKIKQELNLDLLGIKHKTTHSMHFLTRFIYKTGKEWSTEWMEHELDYCLIVVMRESDSDFINSFNREEVECLKWVDEIELIAWLSVEDAKFSPWFRLVCKNFLFNWWSLVREKDYDTKLREAKDQDIHNFVEK